MKFSNMKLLETREVHNDYFSGIQEPKEFDGTVIGKMYPWDEEDNLYVLYCDGDLILAELQE